MKKWIQSLLGIKPKVKHVHTWGEVYLHRGYKYRNCTQEGCNTCTAKDDNGNWLDPWDKFINVD